MGQSLGGATALLSSLHASNSEEDNSDRFMGCILFCPAIRAALPPAPIYYLFRYVLAPLFPKSLVPAAFEQAQKPENLFLSQETTIKFYLDFWGREGGLSWGKSIRFGTGVQLLEMFRVCEENLDKIRFPFVVLHDPADKVVEFSGTQMILDRASTPTSISRGRELHSMDGMKHDLFSNCSERSFGIACDWLTFRVENDFGKPMKA